MAKNFSKKKEEEFQNLISTKKSELKKDKESIPSFVIGGKTYIIKKWSHLETWDLLPAVAQLFYIPLVNSIQPNEFDDDVEVNIADINNIFFTQLLNTDVMEFLPTLCSCVYEKGKNEPIDLNTLPEPSDICKVISEVLHHCFLFLFRGDFMGLLQNGSQVSQVNQAVMSEE